MQPNIFDHATTELSQDAFFAWLMCWADRQYAEQHPVMHETGRHFIAWLFERAARTVPAYDKVEVKRQHENIDLLVGLHGEQGPLCYVLVEDKTYTTDHATQMSGYLTKVKDMANGVEVVPIYIKSWVESTKGKSQEFTRIYLPDLMEFLKSVDIPAAKSEILSSWCDAMQRRYALLLAYQKLPMMQWSEEQWTGCFHELASRSKFHEQELEAGFGKVPQRDGGFVGFWFGWCEKKGSYYVYLQVDAYAAKMPKLSFRMGAGDSGRTDPELAKRYAADMTRRASRQGLIPPKPTKVRGGRSSRFATVDEIRCMTPDGHYSPELMEQELLKYHSLLRDSFAELSEVES